MASGEGKRQQMGGLPKVLAAPLPPPPLGHAYAAPHSPFTLALYVSVVEHKGPEAPLVCRIQGPASTPLPICGAQGPAPQLIPWQSTRTSHNPLPPSITRAEPKHLGARPLHYSFAEPRDMTATKVQGPGSIPTLSSMQGPYLSGSLGGR